ncbi:sulfite exporter TauE/SafE family protein [Thermococcus sp. GR6]|uniref:sulfite exporter TauE/SafE family protein n=1 Tax=Thermococcus sp. GR6 TaxID=1638256 RepID=UPI001431B1DA|nr:sulfite exporter TauE/SafE family protein [Thermococcus sp. GR6]NJE42219.1 sulfite exporter TauE/SafE family protein [Thermococcus sp. GR6]
MLNYLLDFILGLGIGFIAGLFGVGGGFLIVPALTILGLPIHVAIGTSLTCIVLSSLSAVAIHVRKGTVLYRVVLIKEAFSIPAALIGAYISSLLPERTLKFVFALLLVYLSFRMWRGRGTFEFEEKEIKTSRISVVGVASGLTSGLLGISGGILNVPLFHAYVGIPMRYAVGTSSLALFFTALAGSLGHYRLGQVDVHTALLLAPGLLVGARIGALLVHRLHPCHLRRAFSALLIIVALKMLL